MHGDVRIKDARSAACQLVHPYTHLEGIWRAWKHPWAWQLQAGRWLKSGLPHLHGCDAIAEECLVTPSKDNAPHRLPAGVHGPGHWQGIDIAATSGNVGAYIGQGTMLGKVMVWSYRSAE